MTEPILLLSPPPAHSFLPRNRHRSRPSIGAVAASFKSSINNLNNGSIAPMLSLRLTNPVALAGSKRRRRPDDDGGDDRDDDNSSGSSRHHYPARTSASSSFPSYSLLAPSPFPIKDTSSSSVNTVNHSTAATSTTTTMSSVKRCRLPQPTDADGLIPSVPALSRSVPLDSILTGHFPVLPSAPISSIPWIHPFIDHHYLPAPYSPSSPVVLTFDNSHNYSPGKSPIIVIVPGAEGVDQHVYATSAILPNLLAISPTLQTIVLDPHRAGISSEEAALSGPQYPLPTVLLPSRPHPNPLLHLGLLHPSGGSVASSTMPAIVLVDRHARRRLVIPIGWGAGRMWSGRGCNIHPDAAGNITRASSHDSGVGADSRRHTPTPTPHSPHHHYNYTSHYNPLIGLHTDVSAVEISRRLLTSLVSAVAELEQEAQAEDGVAN